MSELIGIRECARRLGVSDTAVRKAIAAGRVGVAGRTEGSDRPLVAWPQAQADWERNTDTSKRHHIGPTGDSARRTKYAGADSVPAMPTHAKVAAGDAVAPETITAAGEGGRPAVNGPTLAQSKALREAYLARIAKLEYEERTGKLVNADEVKTRWYKHITAAKTRILGIPAACKSRNADLPLAVLATIEEICREALEDLANGRD